MENEQILLQRAGIIKKYFAATSNLYKWNSKEVALFIYIVWMDRDYKVKIFL